MIEGLYTLFPPKWPIPHGDQNPHLVHDSLGPHSKWHLDRFSCSTDTDHVTPCVTIVRSRCGAA